MNKILLAIVVVLAVPAVLVGYILVVEGVIVRLGRKFAARIRPWLWLAPALFFLGLFLVYPTIATIKRSFQNRRGDSYIGLENYKWFFTREDTLIALRNNVLWVVFLTAGVVGMGLLIALLADRVKYERVVKSIIFLPMAISFTAAAVIWKLMYDLDPIVGTLNAVGGAISAGPVAWLSTERINNFMLIIVGAWLMTGFAMVILSAGLKGIPTELMEAARIDGATELQVFRKIQLPLLAPTTAVVATTVIIFALKTFDVVYVMTNGNFNTDIMALRMYKELFANGQEGRAAATAVVLLLSTIPVMMYNIRKFRQQEAER